MIPERHHHRRGRSSCPFAEVKEVRAVPGSRGRIRGCRVLRPRRTVRLRSKLDSDRLRARPGRRGAARRHGPANARQQLVRTATDEQDILGSREPKGRNGLWGLNTLGFVLKTLQFG